jgi:1-phosphofructokinase family hexose kinase
MTTQVLCVTPNGSVDLTFRQRQPSPGGIEIDSDLVAETAGGKGHNVARFLAGAGLNVTAAGFEGGWVGARMGTLLQAGGVRLNLSHIDGTNRLFTTVCDADGARVHSWHLKGPAVSPAETAALVAVIERARAIGAERVVLAGSLCPGMPHDFYREAIRRLDGIPVVLDASAPAVIRGVQGAPATLKVNESEFAAIARSAGVATADLARAAGQIRHRFGISTVVVTGGPLGAFAVDGSHVLRVGAPLITVRNTSGAGDAFLAGMLHQAIAGGDLARQLLWGAAWSGAVCEQSAPTVPAPERVEEIAAAIEVRS